MGQHQYPSFGRLVRFEQKDGDCLPEQPGETLVIDGFAGWDPEYQIKVRIICESAYHALFMHNMLIRPTAEELEDFQEPDAVIYNAGNPLPVSTSTVSLPARALP